MTAYVGQGARQTLLIADLLGNPDGLLIALVCFLPVAQPLKNGSDSGVRVGCALHVSQSHTEFQGFLMEREGFFGLDVIHEELFDILNLP